MQVPLLKQYYNAKQLHLTFCSDIFLIDGLAELIIKTMVIISSEDSSRQELWLNNDWLIIDHQFNMTIYLAIVRDKDYG